MVAGCPILDRRAVLSLAATALTASRPRPSRAQTAPPGQARPARMICPAPAGSGPDLAARLLAEGLARRRGHPIAVENRVGADGTLAAGAFAQTRPGDALFFTFSDVLTVAPLMHDRVPYDSAADFEPVSIVADDFFAVSVAVGADQPRTLGELVAMARASPGSLNWYASPGTPDLAFRAFLREAGIDMTYVSYRGAPAALLDLAAGRIAVALTPIAAALPVARDGRIRMLATTAEARSPAAPDLPTTAELGMPSFRITGLLGLFGWRGMTPEARDEFAAQVRAVLAEPATAERFRLAGMHPRASSPAEFEAALAESRARWSALAREFGTRRSL